MAISAYDWVIFITEPITRGLEHYGAEPARLLHCDTFEIDMIQHKLMSVTSCNELMQENSSEIFENEELLKKWVRKEERASACESNLYRKKVVSVLKKPIGMCPKEECMRPRTVGKQKVLHPMNTRFIELWKAELVREYRKRLRIEYFLTRTRRTHRDHSLGSSKYFWETAGKVFEKLCTRYLSVECGVGQSQQLVLEEADPK